MPLSYFACQSLKNIEKLCFPPKAAYAAVTAEYLQDDTKTGDFTYDTGTGKILDTASTTGTAIDGTSITDWTIGTAVGGSTLGKTVYDDWTLTVDDDGTIIAYKAGN